MKKKIGRWKIAFTDVDVYVRDGTGGDFKISSKRDVPSYINIGIDHDVWETISGSVLHEVFELTSLLHNAWMEPVSGFHWNTINRTLMCCHETFSDICHACAPVISEIENAIKQEWSRKNDNA